MKYPVALFIGRFQPFHNGHLWGLKQSFEKAEKIIIGIGSSNISDENNPIKVKARRQMLTKVIEREKWGDRIVEIIELPDTTDAQWVINVKREIEKMGYSPAETLVIGNNDWVNDLLSEAMFPVYEPGLFNRIEWEGVKIRKMIQMSDQSWQGRIPSYLVAEITKTHSRINK